MNILIVIENGQLNTYHLDDKPVWEIGRPSKNSQPDIRLSTTTVSRKHGRFQNMDGIWFYLDHNGKNGTIYHNKHIEAGINGRIKPVMLSEGDVLILGGGEQAEINNRTVWVMFTTYFYGDSWRRTEIKGFQNISISDGAETICLKNPVKGSVITRKSGMAIYTGEYLFLIGTMELTHEMT